MIFLHIVAKLIHVIRHCLNACIRKAVREPQEEDEERGKENESVSGHSAVQGLGPGRLPQKVLQWLELGIQGQSLYKPTT